jgi:hypothetical protein
VRICAQSVSLGARGLVVHGGDRGLHLVGPDRRRGQHRLEYGDALGHRGGVPEPAVLIGERDERAVVPRPRRPARLGEQHQRQQAGHLAVVRQLGAQQSGQPDRLVVSSTRLSSGPELAV